MSSSDRVKRWLGMTIFSKNLIRQLKRKKINKNTKIKDKNYKKMIMAYSSLAENELVRIMVQDLLKYELKKDNNIIIGEAENQPSGTNSYALNIGGLITGDISTDRVRIGGTATDALLASACLELKSTTGALIVPRMTTTQRNNMTAVNGMIIYDTTQNAFRFYENGAWTSK